MTFDDEIICKKNVKKELLLLYFIPTRAYDKPKTVVVDDDFYSSRFTVVFYREKKEKRDVKEGTRSLTSIFSLIIHVHGIPCGSDEWM